MIEANYEADEKRPTETLKKILDIEKLSEY